MSRIRHLARLRTKFYVLCCLLSLLILGVGCATGSVASEEPKEARPTAESALSLALVFWRQLSVVQPPALLPGDCSVP